MPLIHIRSLPIPTSFDPAPVLEGLTRDVAAATGIALEHVSATWQVMQAGAYVVAGQAASWQPADSHPLLVDILSPEFNAPELVETMLDCVATSLAVRCGLPRENIFIHHQAARSGHVFEAGAVVRW